MSAPKSKRGGRKSAARVRFERYVRRVATTAERVHSSRAMLLSSLRSFARRSRVPRSVFYRVLDCEFGGVGRVPDFAQLSLFAS